MSALKPCPFCGANDCEAITAVGETRVLCHNCKASSAAISDHDAALVAWNRRADAPWIREAVRLLKYAADTAERQDKYRDWAHEIAELRAHIEKVKL